MNPLSKIIDPSKLTGDLVNNFQSALTEMSNSTAVNLLSKSKTISDNLSTGISTLTGGISGAASALNKLEAEGSKLLSAVTDPSGMLDKLAKNATGAFSQVQSLLDSVGNMSGQIKAPVFASGTIDTSAITAKMGKLLGDARISVPKFEEFPAEIPANAFQEAQASAIGKLTEVESKIELLKIKLSGVNTKESNFGDKIAQLNRELSALSEQLGTAQRAYERTITGS